MAKVELLLPAGDIEKLKTGLHFGGDAFYVGGASFSLRTACRNFSMTELKKAIRIAHDAGRKIYLALNIYPRPDQFTQLKNYLKKINTLSIDALIVSDLGVLSLIKEMEIEIPLHISTQANIINHYAVGFLKNLNVKRIILARELNRDNIRRIRKAHKDIELEIFVHGAMCMSYSGRCMLSMYLNNLDANQGACTHPCRWKYSLQEETRPGQYFPVNEDSSGTYILNSKDLCLLPYLDDIIHSGIDSIKIEGRVKGEHYIALIARTYRQAIDSYYSDKKNFRIKDEWIKDLASVSNRTYTSGFYPGTPQDMMRSAKGGYEKSWQLVGKVMSSKAGRNMISVRNNICIGDQVEIVSTKGNFTEKVNSITVSGESKKKVTNQKKAIIMFSRNYPRGSLIRKALNGKK